MPEPLGNIRPLLVEEIERLRDLVERLSEQQLVLSTRCVGWRVADLVVHLRMSFEAVLMSLSGVVTAAEPNRDFVTYWSDWPARDAPGFAEVRFTWASTAAYSASAGLKRHFDDTARAAIEAVRTSPEARVPFQGHVMQTADVLRMWATEFAVHHLDLLAEIDDGPCPTDDSLEIAATTLDRLLQAPRPAWWDLSTYILKATGRVALLPEDRSYLGTTAAAYPAFG